MKMKDKVRNIVLDGMKSMMLAKASMDELHRNEQHITPVNFATKENEIRQELENIPLSTMNKVRNEVNRYKDALHEAFLPKGGDITDDAKLLDNPLIPMGEDELRSLAEKYRENPTMLSMILRYADNKNMTSPVKDIPVEASYAKIADDLVGYARQAMACPESEMVFNTDQYFERVTNIPNAVDKFLSL